MRRLLHALGVRAVDLDDLQQEAVIAAWRSMKAGRFAPSPGRPTREALRAWMVGITWRVAMHYRQKAHRRYERSAGDMQEISVKERLEDRLDARRALRIAARLPAWVREVLALRAEGHDRGEIAAKLEINANTASTRIRIARSRLHRALSRWRFARELAG